MERTLLEWCPVPVVSGGVRERCNSRVGVWQAHVTEERTFTGDGPEGADRTETVIVSTILDVSCSAGHTLEEIEAGANEEL